MHSASRTPEKRLRPAADELMERPAEGLVRARLAGDLLGEPLADRLVRDG